MSSILFQVLKLVLSFVIGNFIGFELMLHTHSLWISFGVGIPFALIAIYIISMALNLAEDWIEQGDLPRPEKGA